MQVRVVDLDGSIVEQRTLMERYHPTRYELRAWGPAIRLGCRFGRFEQFTREVADCLADRQDPAVTMIGSGDFHHVTLALLRRLQEPFNLLVIDNHPDWMRGIPFMHCGTWLWHAARLPNVCRIFHVGGNVDFDNRFRWLAPWSLLRSGKMTVWPAFRRYQTGRWGRIVHLPVRLDQARPATNGRLEELLSSCRYDLWRFPLYVSLDKDVMAGDEAVVNWDSGHLTRSEVEKVLRAFVEAAGGRLAGIDIVGDWSPVQTRGLFRRFLHWTEHPSLAIDPAWASKQNEQTNLALLKALAVLQESRCLAAA